MSELTGRRSTRFRRAGTSIAWNACLLASTLFAESVVSAGVRPLSLSLHLQPVVAATGAPHTENQEIRPLEPGKSIKRQLAGGQVHYYKLRLSAGDYARVLVDQLGIDVVVRLLGPNGRKLSEMDSPNGMYGPEILSFVADSPMSCTVQVQSLESDAAIGAYDLTIEDVHPVVTEDRGRIIAELTFADATQLFAKGTTESLRTAIGKYQEAQQLFESAGEHRVKACALNAIGDAYKSLGQPGEAFGYYYQAIALYKAAGNHGGEALAYNNIGAVHNDSGDKKRALEFYRKALSLISAVEHQGIYITTLNNFGSAYYSLGDKTKAIDSYKESLQLNRRSGNRKGEGVCLNNLGVVYQSLGDNERALGAYSAALKIREGASDLDALATTLTNIGAAYRDSDDMPRALVHLNRALKIKHDLGDKPGEAAALANIAAAYRAFGQNRAACESYEKALPLFQHAGDRTGEARVSSLLADVYYSLTNKSKALDLYGRAVALAELAGDPGYKAAAMFGIARIERDSGNLPAARARSDSALAIIESLRTNVVSQELRALYSAKLQPFYDFCTDLLMRLHKQQPSSGFDGLALQANERARARGLIEMLTEAGADIRRDLDPELIERERSLHQALNATSRHQMRMLAGSHTKEQAAASAQEVSALTADYQDVQAHIRAQSPRYAALTQPQQLTLSEIQNQVLDSDTLLLEYMLGSERSYLWAVSQSSILSFELPNRAEIESAARRVYYLLTAPNRIEKDETPRRKRSRVAEAETEYPEAAKALSRILLSQVTSLLGKKRLVIVSDGALQYVPFGALSASFLDDRPSGFAETPSSEPKKPAPPFDYKPLVTEHEIISLPSASVLAALRRETAGRKPAAKTVAVLADPVFDRSDSRVRKETSGRRAVNYSSQPVGDVRETDQAVRDVELARDQGRLMPLPFSGREAKAILGFVPSGEGMLALDFKASRTTATSPELAQYRIVHFATHGLLDSNHPELSALVFSLVDEYGEPQDGFLRLHDIYGLKLPAELVVLSACQTALGKDIRGEGLVGLTRGFMYAGAARIAASLWQVNDRATAELMSYFYRGMMRRGLRPAAALQAAQVEMWKQKRWKSPYYWAAFVLQGDWK